MTLLAFCHPQATHECPQKMSANSVHQAIRNIHRKVLFYYIDKKLKIEGYGINCMNNPHKFPSFKKWFCDLEDWRQNPLFPESHVCCSIHNVTLTTFACFRIPRSLFICPAENWLLWLLILEVVKLTESFLRGSLELIFLPISFKL